MKILDLVTFLLLVIGGLNWGLISFFDFNLVTYIFASMPIIVSIIYWIVGISAIIQVILFAQVRWVES